MLFDPIGTNAVHDSKTIQGKRIHRPRHNLSPYPRTHAPTGRQLHNLD
jgi:hypothetical protein